MFGKSRFLDLTAVNMRKKRFLAIFARLMLVKPILAHFSVILKASRWSSEGVFTAYGSSQRVRPYATL